jgi:hypothetical protein
MQKHPNDEYLQSVVKDLIADIFVKNKMRYIDFCDYPQGTSIEDIAQTGEDTTRQTGSKYDRIKQQNMSAKVLPDPKFKTVNYMLVDIHSDSLFKVLVNDAVVNGEMQAVLEAVSDGHIGNERSVLIAMPIYHIYSDNGNITDQSADRRNAEQLQKIMCRAAKRAHVTPVTLQMDFKHPETEQYNSFVKINQWYQDFANAGALDMRYHTSEFLDDVSAGLGSRKLCYVTVSDVAGRRFYVEKLFLPWLIPVFPYTFPAVVSALSLGTYDVDVNCLILDIIDGTVESSAHFSQSEVMRKAYINGFVYRELERYLRP